MHNTRERKELVTREINNELRIKQNLIHTNPTILKLSPSYRMLTNFEI